MSDMIDFRYFTNDAEEDFQTSLKFLQNNNPRKSAFYNHLALEKYLKAFFIKNQVINDPKEIGHIRYSVITEKIIEVLKNDANRFLENKGYQTYVAISVKYLEKNKEVFKILESSQDLQISYWKQSLGIALTKHEENITTGMVQKLMQNLCDFINNLASDAQNSQNEPPVTMIKNKTVLNDIGNLFENYFESCKNDGIENVDTLKFLEKLDYTMTPIYFGHGPDSMSLEDTNTIQRLFLLLSSVKWNEIAYTSYCHRQISQYPTIINGKNSIDLYNEHIPQLKQFISQTRSVCDEIKSQIL
jgi:hypothetical protein